MRAKCLREPSNGFFAVFHQDISKVLPLTYTADALRKVMVLGAGIPEIATELTVLIAFGVFMIAIAVPVFKRAMTR